MARLPWTRGPAAWKLSQRADEILLALDRESKRFFSLRSVAKLFQVSTQPVRDWTRLDFLERTGPRLLYEKDELRHFVVWVQKSAKPFSSKGYLKRFRVTQPSPRPFDKLRNAQFIWPKRVPSLTPSELAELIGCHPSLIIKAIFAGYIRGQQRSPCRWLVSRRSWSWSFPMSMISEPRIPSLPRGDLISTRDAAQFLMECGFKKVDQRYIRDLIKERKLDSVRSTPGRRKIFVKRTSLKLFWNSLKNS